MLSKLIRWATITRPGPDNEQFATQQVAHRGKLSKPIMLFPYGYHANLQPGSLGLLFAAGCHEEDRAFIGWTPKDRPKLAPGEVAFYHPDSDSFVIWRNGGNLDIDVTDSTTVNIANNATITAGGDVDLTCTNATVNATTVTISATTVQVDATTFTVNANSVFNGTMTNNGKDVGDTHGHVQGNDSNGDTEAPINGVT